MAKKATIAICLACLSGSAVFAQDFTGVPIPAQDFSGAPIPAQNYAGAQVYPGGNAYGSGAPNGYVDGAQNGYGGGAPNEYVGGASIGSTEPLYPYDDQEKWKHGWIQEMPYYHGYHSFRPYNYHHVFGQSQTAAAAGMPSTMPYSQQWWHRYAQQANLNRSNQFPQNVVPPDSYYRNMNSQAENERIQRQLVEIQSQLNAQKRLNAGSTLGGVPMDQQRQFGAASYNEPVFVSEAVPTVYQQTVPPQALGPLYVTPNYPIETNATAPAAQKLELIRYMQGGGGPALPPR